MRWISQNLQGFLCFDEYFKIVVLYRVYSKSNVSDLIVKWLYIKTRSDRLDLVEGIQLSKARLLSRLRPSGE